MVVLKIPGFSNTRIAVRNRSPKNIRMRIDAIAYLFPLFFVAMFVFLLFYLSKKGWWDLANQYKFEGLFQGERVGIISAGINGLNYNNCLVLKYNDEGFYLRPIFIFRLFHKPLLIPWKAIKNIRDKKILFVRLKELVIGEPAIAIMQMKNSTFSKIERMIILKAVVPK